MLPQPSETEIQASCLAWLKYNGVHCWRQSSHGVYRKDIDKYIFHGLRGVSDILGIMPLGSKKPGAFLAVEVKRSDGVVSDDQKLFLDAITNNGGVALVVRSVSELEADMAQFLDLNQSRMEF